MDEATIATIDGSFNALLANVPDFEKMLEINGGHSIDPTFKHLTPEQRSSYLLAQLYGVNSKLHVILANNLMIREAENLTDEMNEKLKWIKFGFEFYRAWLTDTNKRQEDIVNEILALKAEQGLNYADKAVFTAFTKDFIQVTLVNSFNDKVMQQNIKAVDNDLQLLHRRVKAI